MTSPQLSWESTQASNRGGVGVVSDLLVLVTLLDNVLSYGQSHRFSRSQKGCPMLTCQVPPLVAS